VSKIIRSYLEDQWQLHAPRLTTEEFLSDISRDAPFSANQRILLVEFLQDCDLVKFAEHCPCRDEIVRAIDSCKAFIQATAPPQSFSENARLLSQWP
jgi:hypothetical protein